MLNLKDDTLRINDGWISAPKPAMSKVYYGAEMPRPQLLAPLGPIQFSDVVIAEDSLTGMSRTLLCCVDRPYLTTSKSCSMQQFWHLVPILHLLISSAWWPMSVPKLWVKSRGSWFSGRLGEASDTLAAFTAKLKVAKAWGGGMTASADMMSMYATRALWSARSNL